MNNKKDIHSITYLKTNASDVLQQVNETQRPVIITQNGEPRGVLQDARSYENMKNALGLMKAISPTMANYTLPLQSHSTMPSAIALPSLLMFRTTRVKKTFSALSLQMVSTEVLLFPSLSKR